MGDRVDLSTDFIPSIDQELLITFCTGESSMLNQVNLLDVWQGSLANEVAAKYEVTRNLYTLFCIVTWGTYFKTRCAKA
jgi:hypothetical protein